ncbi:hypothetical protein HY948_04815 [Candidatus Gottesmanbacteria bacterium]|nr:hypothetical protein [Candidatus Gottesmanbacteria bacterium]
MKTKIVFLILMLASIAAVLPLLRPGFIPTHDGEYHLIRFYEFETMLRSGYWFPRWAPGLNSGYGLPLFNFHYPLPNYIGVFFHALGWNLTDSFKLALAAGYLSAGLFCYVWLSKIFGKFSGAVGTIAFLFVPYWFVELYVRGSIGEVIFMAWFMLLLAAVEHQREIVISLATAGMILSHNILSIVFFPIVVIYLFIRRWRYLGYAMMGLGLSAYFWIPAILERNFMVGLNVVNFREHFPELSQLLIPSWGTNFSQVGVPDGEMSQQLGVIAVVAAFLAFVCNIFERKRWLKILVSGGLVLFLFVILLMQTITLPLWEFFSVLQFVQYPWRLLVVVMPLAGFFVAYVSYRIRARWVAIGLAILCIGFSLQYMNPVVYMDRDDAYYLSRREFTDGTSSLGNSFSTVWSPWKSSRAAQSVEVLQGKGTIIVQTQTPLTMRAVADIEEDAVIRLNRLYFPGWVVMIDGNKQLINYSEDGTIFFSARKGVHAIEVLFAETPIRVGADLISIVSLSCMMGLGILRRYAYCH